MRFADGRLVSWDDPWPDEMTIATTVDDEFLLQFLFLRSTCALTPATPVPELEPAPPASTLPIGPELRDAWNAEWDRQWKELWAWRHRLNRCRRDGTMDNLFSRIGKPPLWPMELGDYFDRAAFAAWKATVVDQDREQAQRERPEVKYVEELAAAWRRGLQEIVVLPYRGEFSRPVEGFALEVSRTSYLNPTSLRSALETFARPG